MKNGWYWPFLIAGLMVLILGINLVFVYVATTDPSFAVEPDYYRKALAWDEKRAQDGVNERLGWHLALDVAPRAPDGKHEVIARLTDAAGEPVSGASVHLRAFHNARAGRVLAADLRQVEPGAYAARLPLHRSGLWEFRLEALRGDERFTHRALEALVLR